MSIVENMSEPERQSWITLLADSVVLVWFWKTMAPGWSLLPGEFSPAAIGEIYLKLVIITIFLHAVIATAFALRSRATDILQDERDVQIVGQGTKIGYHLLQIGLGIIIVSAILNYVIGSDYLSPISLETPVQFLFLLTLLAYVADLARHAVIVYRYRAD